MLQKNNFTGKWGTEGRDMMQRDDLERAVTGLERRWQQDDEERGWKSSSQWMQ